jgi:hypothetical protein
MEIRKKRQEGTGRGERNLCRTHQTCVELTKHYLGDKIKKKEIGGACSTYVGEKRLYRGLWEQP